jgi:hypothetical protein
LATTVADVTSPRQEPPGYLPDDVIAGVLGSLEVSIFTSDASRIHPALACLREKYPVLRGFTFSTGDLYPFSRLLERVLTRLQLARLIGMDNPDYERYRISDGAKKFIQDEVLPRFTPDQQAEIRAIAAGFGEACGIPE